jgi:hypothetical protein
LRAAASFSKTICRTAFTALLLCASSARGQRTEASVDAGGLGLRYADTVNTGAVAVTGHALFARARTVTDAAGTVSQFFSGGSSIQGAISASYFAPSGRRLLTELGGFAGGSAHHDGTRTGEVLANLRLHYLLERGEIFAGAGFGHSSFGDGGQRMLLGEVGGSTRINELDASFVVSPVVLDSIQYADTQLSVSWTHGDLDIDGVAGLRVGDQPSDLGSTTRTWGSVSAVAWLTPRLGAVLSGGTYPIDPTQGFPGGRFVSASIRFALGRRRESETVMHASPPNPTGSDASQLVESFRWSRSRTGEVTLRVAARQAQTVEISGDFTNWVPASFAKTVAGSWTLTLPLAPGKYQMNLRVNGGKWTVPPGLLFMDDEFGGTVGLLVIE